MIGMWKVMPARGGLFDRHQTLGNHPADPAAGGGAGDPAGIPDGVFNVVTGSGAAAARR